MQATIIATVECCNNRPVRESVVNINQILNMVLRAIMRRGVNSALNAGLSKLPTRKRRDRSTDEARPDDRRSGDQGRHDE
jgi:hypothetical protein